MIDAIDILVPVYKNVDLVKACVDSLVAIKDEVAAYRPRIIVINDSPDDVATSRYLEEAAQSGLIDLLIVNECNVGFVRSVNTGLAEARKRKAAALLVNSDTVSFPGTLKEIIEVANLDDQIGFVCPRSNNASICTFPQSPHYRSGRTTTAEDCYQTWRSVQGFLPRYTFAPTAVGFYMLIKYNILVDFGGLDEEFGLGYEEENDFVMRANKVGFRAVLANHAYAYHAGSASFMLQNINLDSQRRGNFLKMKERHPEFLPLVKAYESSSSYRVERALRNLVPDQDGKLGLVLNCLAIGPYFNGTNELVVNVIREMGKARDGRFNVTILMEAEAAAFFGLDKLKNIRITEEIIDQYAVAIAFGQPYDLHSLNVLEVLAPINVVGMLDAISLDCGYLRVEQQMEDVWASTVRHSNGLFFISEFGKETIHRRFKVGPSTRSYARLLSTKVADYEERYKNVRDGQRHVFIAGNHFRHKASNRCAQILSKAFPSLYFHALGEGSSEGNVHYMNSGNLSDDTMIDMMAGSSVIVLPSYYEGFGFSIMHALALRKPVVARDIPATREIMASFAAVEGVFVYADDSELPDALSKALSVAHSRVDDSSAGDWAEWTNGLLDFLSDLVDPAAVYEQASERMRERDWLRRLYHLEKSSAGGAMATFSFDELSRLDDYAFVEFIYKHILGREPDAAGITHHLTLLAQGASRQGIINAFLTSEEYLRSERQVEFSGLKKKKNFWARVGRALKA
ncbi:GT2 family glycosyltransferase [Sphingobium sp. B7D2B]|uniref:DUF4214 domain-containing protein n=1 Tax=Sphingobium sp. B7D2B TaxID=2940583 RepID=UPI0022258840|nr:DUF4214 domain-containing protein [Sphingobium sp. B7D2B]MCW2366813.1 GT2 family glycosyltransferase [Sphingobium sp. B7D2B]